MTHTQRDHVRWKYDALVADYRREAECQQQRWEKSLCEAKERLQKLVAAKNEHKSLRVAGAERTGGVAPQGELLRTGFHVTRGVDDGGGVSAAHRLGHRIQEDPRVKARVQSIVSQSR